MSNSMKSRAMAGVAMAWPLALIAVCGGAVVSVAFSYRAIGAIPEAEMAEIVARQSLPNCNARVSYRGCNQPAACQADANDNCPTAGSPCQTGCSEPNAQNAYCNNSAKIADIYNCFTTPDSAGNGCGFYLTEATCTWDESSQQCVCSGRNSTLTCAEYSATYSTKCFADD